MFARRVSMNLKPNSVAELTQRLEKPIKSCRTPKAYCNGGKM